MHLISFDGSYKRNLKRMGIDLSTLTPINYQIETHIFGETDEIILLWSKASSNLYLINDEEDLMAIKLGCPSSRGIFVFYDIPDKVLQFLKLVDIRLQRFGRKNSSYIFTIYFEDGKIDEVVCPLRFQKVIKNYTLYRELRDYAFSGLYHSSFKCRYEKIS